MRYLPRPGGATVNGKLKKVKIELITEGRAVEVPVSEGTFTTYTEWQKISFALVDNVLSMKITALETAGQSASQRNKFASAAELRATTNVSSISSKQIVDKEDLNDLISQASSLKENEYTPESWKEFSEVPNVARMAAEHSDATGYNVLLATANLAYALPSLVVAPTPTPTPTPNPNPVNPTPGPNPQPTPNSNPRPIPTPNPNVPVNPIVPHPHTGQMVVPVSPGRNDSQGKLVTKDHMQKKNLAKTGVMIVIIASFVILCAAIGMALTQPRVVHSRRVRT